MNIMTDEIRAAHSRRLHGKRALVTAAAQGIGRAIALRLAEEGGRPL